MKYDIVKKLLSSNSINVENIKYIENLLLKNKKNGLLFLDNFDEMILFILWKNYDINNKIIKKYIKFIIKNIFKIRKFRILIFDDINSKDFLLINKILDYWFQIYQNNEKIIKIFKKSFYKEIKKNESDYPLIKLILLLRVEKFLEIDELKNNSFFNNIIKENIKLIINKEKIKYNEIKFLWYINFMNYELDKNSLKYILKSIFKTINYKLNLNKYYEIPIYFETWIKILDLNENSYYKRVPIIKLFLKKIFKFFNKNIESCEINILDKILNLVIKFLMEKDKLKIELNNVFSIIEDNLKIIIKNENLRKNSFNEKKLENNKNFKKILIKNMIFIKENLKLYENILDLSNMENNTYLIELVNIMIEEFNLALSINGIWSNEENLKNPYINNENNEEIESYIILEILKLYLDFFNNNNLKLMIFQNLTNKISIKNIGIQLNSNIKLILKNFLNNLSNFLNDLLKEETNYNILKNILKELNKWILIDELKIMKIRKFIMKYIKTLSNNKDYIIKFFKFFVKKFKKIRYSVINIKKEKINFLYSIYFKIFNYLMSRSINNSNLLNSSNYQKCLSILITFSGIDIMILSDNNLTLINKFYLYCSFFIYDINRIDNNFIYCNELIDVNTKNDKLISSFNKTIKNKIPKLKGFVQWEIFDCILLYSIFNILNNKIEYIKNSKNLEIFYLNNNIIYLSINFLKFSINFKSKHILIYEIIQKIVEYFINQYIDILKNIKNLNKSLNLASYDFSYLIYFFCSDIKNTKIKNYIKIYIETFPQVLFKEIFIKSINNCISKVHLFLNEKFNPIKNVISMNFIDISIKINYEKEDQVEILSYLCSIFLILYINNLIFNKELIQQTISNFISFLNKENENNKLFGIKYFNYVNNICQNLLNNNTLIDKMNWFKTKKIEIKYINEIIKNENSDINNIFKKFIKNTNNNNDMLLFIKNIKNNFIQNNNLFSEITVNKTDYKNELISTKLNEFKNLCFYYKFFLYTNNLNYNDIKYYLSKFKNLNKIDLYFNDENNLKNNYQKFGNQIKKKLKHTFSILVIFCELSPNLSRYILKEVIKLYLKTKLSYLVKYILKYFFNKLFIDKYLSYNELINYFKIISLDLKEIIDSKYRINEENDNRKNIFYYKNKNKMVNDYYIEDINEIKHYDLNNDLDYFSIIFKKINFEKQILESIESFYFISNYMNINLNYLLINKINKLFIYDLIIYLTKINSIYSYNNINLKIFVEINETMINFIYYLIINKIEFKKLKSLIKNYIIFSLNNLLKEFFIVEKKETILSCQNMSLIKNIIFKWINIKIKLKEFDMNGYLTKESFIKDISKFEKSFYKYVIKSKNKYLFIKYKENIFYDLIKKEDFTNDLKLIIIILIDSLIEFINSSFYFEYFLNIEFSYINKNYFQLKYSQMGYNYFTHYINLLSLIDIRLGYLFKEKFKYLIVDKEKTYFFEIDKIILKYNKNLINDELFFKSYLKLWVEEKNLNFNNFYYFKIWKIPNIPILLSLCNFDFDCIEKFDLFGKCLVSNLLDFKTDQVIFYLSQLTQFLDTEFLNYILKFFYLFSKKSILFSHQLIWLSLVECKLEEGENINMNKKKREISKNIRNFIISSMDNQRKDIFLQIDSFFESLTSISSMMEPKFEKEKKILIIKEAVHNIKVPKFAYMPTDPYKKIIDIDLNSGKPMQSAAKCPFLLTFRCQNFEGIDSYFNKSKKIENKKENINTLKNKFFRQNYNLDIDLIDINSNYNLSRTNSKYIIKNIFNEKKENSVLFKGIDEHLKLLPNNSKLKLEDDSLKYDKNFFNSKKISNIFKTEVENEKKIKKSVNNKIEEHEKISIIFKTKDDVRQDNLCLNIIRIIQEIFLKENLNLYLFPYKTISNRTGKEQNIGGLIEVIPNSSSRDQIGKTNDYNLKKYFLEKFGPENSQIYDYARENFIKSLAAYSIVSYILQIKDRHNGNILIDDYGHLIHIDYGFIFSISPGKNLGFEKADFKLTDEMIEIIGKNKDSEFFKFYMELIIKGFLSIRKHYEELLEIVIISEKTGLKCFLKNALKNFKERFLMDRTEKECCEKIKEIIHKAVNNFFTNFYDEIQYIQQKIAR